MNLGDALLLVWFAAVLVSVVYVAWDAFTYNPEMKVMKIGWVLVTLYTGPIGLILYVLSCKEPRPGTHEAFIRPLWKQGVGSTIHCLAGDATGIIFAAAVTGFLATPMWVESVSEYAFGFAVGLLIFQALFMKDMMGGSYVGAVRKTILPEWISMNAMMGVMTAVMVILMTRDMAAMEPTSLRFWGIMSLATIAAGVFAYPLNVWLVWAGLKHGMGTERALGKGGSPLSLPSMESAHEGSPK